MSENPVFVYDKELLADLRQKLPYLDIRAPDGNEPSLVFAKMYSVEQITLPYHKDTPGHINPEILYQVGMVKWAYENLQNERGLSTALSHVSGIDPRRSFIYRRLEAGLLVGAYQSGDYDGCLHGNYVSPDIGASLDSLGVPHDWAISKTHYAFFKVTKEHCVLETIAASFRGTKGGARQFFLTDLKDRKNYAPASILPQRQGARLNLSDCSSGFLHGPGVRGER